LLQRGEKPAAKIELGHVTDAARQLAKICEGNDVIITHGNGPQVGMLALESANDPALEHPFPLDVLVAQTQGMIGYWIVQALGNLLDRRVVTIVTQTVVDAHDPALSTPTKFVGRGYTKAQVDKLRDRHWIFKQDGDSWRRVVPSPEPIEVVEMSSVTDLLAKGSIVVCGGGGGIPVTRDRKNGLKGVEAVVDKDLASALIAREVRADVLLLLTDVPVVYEDYGKATQHPLRQATVSQLRAMDFSPGSMGPKVDAACRFVQATGKRASIGTFDDSLALLEGSVGTSILP
jgi:carbamate kinase